MGLYSVSKPTSLLTLASRQVMGLSGQHGMLLLIRVSQGADRC